MILAFEGIDGAGKTATARALFARLKQEGMQVQYVAKSSVTFDDPYVKAEMTKLRGLIWPPAECEPSSDVFGTHYYLYLIAAWYSAVERWRLSAWQASNELVIVDGWYYRTIVKAHLRQGLDISWLETLFKHVSAPTAVVLLDIEPALAWQRRSTFKSTELGRWDGFTGDDRAAFCAYQENVRTHLLRLSSAAGWKIVKQAEDLSLEHTIDLICSIIPEIDDRRTAKVQQSVRIHAGR